MLPYPSDDRTVRVGVVAAQYFPELPIKTPAKGWLFAAGRGAFGEGKDTFVAVMKNAALPSSEGNGGRGTGAALAVVLVYNSLVATYSALGAITGAVDGGLQGAFSAPDSKGLKEAEQQVQNALSNLRIQESMADRLAQTLQTIPLHRFQILPREGPRTPDAKPRYEALAGHGFLFAVESRVQSLSLEGSISANPLLHISLLALARVVRVSDGTPVYEGVHRYQSEDHVTFPPLLHQS